MVLFPTQLSATHAPLSWITRSRSPIMTCATAADGCSKYHHCDSSAFSLLRILLVSICFASYPVHRSIQDDPMRDPTPPTCVSTLDRLSRRDAESYEPCCRGRLSRFRLTNGHAPSSIWEIVAILTASVDAQTRWLIIKRQVSLRSFFACACRCKSTTASCRPAN